MHSSQSGCTAARSASSAADAARRLVHDERVAAFGQAAHLGLARRRTPGQEPDVGEPVDREARRAQHREHRRRPGHRTHREARVDRAVDDDVARVAEQRRARVAHQRDACARVRAARATSPRAFGLVVVVIADHAAVDVHPGALREIAEPARVLGEHDVGRFEHAPRARRQVVVVADRHRDDEQRAARGRRCRARGSSRRPRPSASASGAHELAVDLGRALRRVVRERAAPQPGPAPEHERVVAEKERRSSSR